MASRIERLERLEELRRMGALTDAEYEQEKARTLDGSISDSPQAFVEQTAWVSPDADNTSSLSGIRASWASSPLGRNKPLAMAIVIISALLLGLLLRSFFVTGLWLAVCSAGAYWLYTGLRIEQKPEHERGTAVWRVFFYAACGLILVSVVLPRLLGRKSAMNATTVEAASNDGIKASTSEERQAIGAQQVTATLSCRVNGMPTQVGMCFVGNSHQEGGSLKISSAGATKLYTDLELQASQPESDPTGAIKFESTFYSDPAWQIPLTIPFYIKAQTQGDSDYVLHIVIRNGSKVLYQDETSGYGVLSADSDSAS